MNSSIKFKGFHYLLVFTTLPLCLLLFAVGFIFATHFLAKFPILNAVIGGIICLLASIFFVCQIINISKYNPAAIEKMSLKIFILLGSVIVFLIVCDNYFFFQKG